MEIVTPKSGSESTEGKTMKKVAEKSSVVRKEGQEQCKEQIYLNPSSKDPEERKNYLRKLWKCIISASRKIPSGSGFILYGECGLMRRERKAEMRKLSLFDLKAENGIT